MSRSPLHTRCLPSGFAAALLSAPYFFVPAAVADTFKLKSGETFEAEVLLEKPDKYWVRTFAGAKWINRADVAELSRSPSPWQRYEAAKKGFPMTAVGQFELAMWCGGNGLADEKDKHLRIAVGLEPNYEPACLALGYVKQGDRWVAPKKESLDMPRRPVGPGVPGTVSLEKPDRPMPVEKPTTTLAKTAAREEEAERRARNVWSHGISQIYANFLTRKNAEAQQEGARRILAITDPLAADGVIDNLAHRSDSPIRRLCARALANFKSDRTVLQLTVMALTDSDPQVVDEARRSLRTIADPRAVALFRKGLEGPEDLLERCAGALAALDDFDGVPSLIGVLVGRQRTTADQDPDALAAYLRLAQRTFGNAPILFEPNAHLITEEAKSQLAGNAGPVGRRTKPPTGMKMRTEVQNALVLLSGNKENFGFVPADWRNWYNRKAAERAAAAK